MKRWQRILAFSFLALTTSTTSSGCWNQLVQPPPMRRPQSRAVIQQPTLAPNPAQTPLKVPTEFDQIENVPADSILKK